jgi:hypothetical protein
MPSFVYQDVTNLVRCISLRRYPGVLMNVVLMENCTLATRFLNVAKFTTLIPLPKLFSRKLSLPIVGLKIFSLSSFALKSPKKLSYHT